MNVELDNIKLWGVISSMGFMGTSLCLQSVQFSWRLYSRSSYYTIHITQSFSRKE